MAIHHSFFQRSAAVLLGKAHQRAAHSWAARYGVMARPNTTDNAQLLDVVAYEPYVFDLDFEPEVIVDIGANVGFASLQLAEKYPHASVVSFEPEPGNYKSLVENTQAVVAIKPVQAVVTPYPEREIRCYNCGGEWGFVFESVRDETRDDFKSAEVSNEEYSRLATISPQHIVEQYVGTAAGNALLKVNIAGFEHELFAGDTSWIDAFRAVALRVPWPMDQRNQEALFTAFQKTKHAYAMRALNTLLLFEREDCASTL